MYSKFLINTIGDSHKPELHTTKRVSAVIVIRLNALRSDYIIVLFSEYLLAGSEANKRHITETH